MHAYTHLYICILCITWTIFLTFSEIVFICSQKGEEAQGKPMVDYTTLKPKQGEQKQNKRESIHSESRISLKNQDTTI